uniref:Uncharacterized protein n=1 Tax=Anopheles culicifacies TaxID=139723 RepID=A0A182M8C1_9DIPT
MPVLPYHSSPIMPRKKERRSLRGGVHQGVVRIVRARVAVRSAQQGSTRSLPVQPALVVLGLVRSVTVRFDPQHEQDNENDSDEGTCHDADDHSGTLFGFGVDAATFVLGKARRWVRLRMRLIGLLWFRVGRFGHLHRWWSSTVRRLMYRRTVFLSIILIVGREMYIHNLFLGGGWSLWTNRRTGGGRYNTATGGSTCRCTGTRRSHRNRRAVAINGTAVTSTTATKTARSTTTAHAAGCVHLTGVHPLHLPELLAVDVVNTSVTSPLPEPCRQSSSSHSFSPGLPRPRPPDPSLPPPPDAVVAVCL